MHKFDYSVPHFVTCVRGTRIVVTLDLISKVLHVPRVEFANYPNCKHLRTVSKDDLFLGRSSKHPLLEVCKRSEVP